VKAPVINCTLAESAEPSHTEALADVVAERPPGGVESGFVRALDPGIAPGLVGDADDGDARPSGRGGHLGPGPGPDRLEDRRGREWAHSRGHTMADRLWGVAQALMAGPPPPPGP
jgi:hypothetical protein